MVKRILVAALLMASLFVATPAWADERAEQIRLESQSERAGPAVSADRPLVLQYPPESLRFYTEGASWYDAKKQFRNGMNTVLEAFFQFLAMLATLVIRTVDLAWNLNLVTWFGTIIDAIVGRYTNLVWSFAGALFTLTSAWVLSQVAQGKYSRIMGHMAVLIVVLSLVISTRGGVAKSVALVEDAGSEVAAKILVAGSATRTTQQATVTSMTDAIYKQLILEPWARANFASVQVATMEEYQAKGIPGGRYLGLSDEEAQEQFKKDDGPNNKALSPWYDGSSLGRRLGVVLDSFLSLVLFMPMLLLLAAVVLGFKAFTVFLAMGIPVALFIAAMPWARGLGFLRAYATWTCASVIVKVICSFALALYIAFLNGLIDAAHTVTGGWLTVTLIMGAMAITGYLLIMWPFRRHKTDVKVRRPRAPKPVTAEPSANGGAPKRPRVVPNNKNIRWVKTKTGRRLQVLRPGQQPEGAEKAAPGPSKGAERRRQAGTRRTAEKGETPSGSRRRWILEQYINSRQRSGPGGMRSPRLQPDYHVLDLMREAKRVMHAMARAAENMGRRR
ncbi:MAG TPA: hypothetical protein VNT01_01255 [Symbiobacteriaceae bacterium]|nr:hypothetical protein [Symbiobacteriaceae bacterium]